MTDETRTLIDAAVEHLPEPKADLSTVPGAVTFLKPPGTSFEIVDIEKFGDAPRRIRQTATFETPKAFTDYVKDFAGPTTRIFASLAKREVRASVDFHGIDTPSWRNHAAVYPALFAPAFAAWHKAHGTPMPQRAFAEFLEDRAEDAVAPEPADLMEVAQRFEAIRTVNFISAQNVSTNERQFRYEEKDAAGGGVACPKVIRLRTPVFSGCEPVEWAVRLAYDISDGKLSFTVKIHRLQELLDAEFTRLCDGIAVDCPGIPLHRGEA